MRACCAATIFCMLNTLLAVVTIIFIANAPLLAADNDTPKIPADEQSAAKAIKDSPRHGEWVDVPLADGSAKIHTWVVYPEIKEKAPVVLVIHEIFGMTDWVRAVADQLAAEGFIAVAPDLLSGTGDGGGGTESFKGADVRAAIQKLKKDEVVQ